MNSVGTPHATASATEIATLARRLTGPVFTPGDEGYDPERAGFQTARRHRPALVVGAADADDVRHAVRFAAELGSPVAVQGTGHALAAVAAEGGVLITTGRMADVRVDAAAGTARVPAGARWDQVIAKTAPAGLAPPSGSAPHVGAVSYTLGGGLGPLSRRYGYAADHVRALDVVTPDGRPRHVTAERDPDLFWAIRGGRDNFGVVTGLEIGLLPVTRLYGGGLFFPGDLAWRAFDHYRRWTATVPEEMTSSIALIAFPDVPALPEPLRGRHAVHVRVAYCGDAAAGARLVAPLRAIGRPLIDTLDELPYTAAGSIWNDPPDPSPFECGNLMLRDLDDAALRALLDRAGPGATVPHALELRHLGGALARRPEAGNAVGRRDARYLLAVVSRLDRADLDVIRPAHRALLTALAPWGIGRSLNFLHGEMGVGQVRSAYDEADFMHLSKLKAAYDPENLFRLNHNIPPAVTLGCGTNGSPDGPPG